MGLSICSVDCNRELASLKMAKQDTALIPRLAQPAGSQAVGASRYWQPEEEQRGGVREEGWFLERSSESPRRQRGKANPCKWSAKELEMRLWNWKWRTGRRMKIAYQTILSLVSQLRVLHNIRSQRFFFLPFLLEVSQFQGLYFSLSSIWKQFWIK